MRLTSTFLALLPFLTSKALAAIYDDPSKLPANSVYDLVVVGAGTAGNVIAARLAENSNYRVLVIKAGRHNEGFQDELIKIPFFGPIASPDTSFDWNYTTVPQAAINNQNIPFPRGYVLGGSSSTNYMVYTRGPKDDYDSFAKIAGDEGWNWDNIVPYALKNEKHVPPNDGHDESNQYIPSLHGTSGPLQTSLYGWATDTDDRIIQITNEVAEFPYNPDYNSGNPLGISWMHSTVGGHLRSSSATAYLNPALSSRTNIDLLYNAQVTRLIQTGSVRPFPIFRGVEFARSSSALRFSVTASKEVILSAGAIGTPQILLLSGIGPASELEKVGITAIVDHPEVGKNLVDHPLLPIQFHANSTTTMDDLLRGGQALEDGLEEYYATGKGRLAANGVSNHMSFWRLPANSNILSQHGDPASGPTAPHYEHAYGNGFFTTSQPIPQSGAYFSIVNVVVSPTSKGSVTLASRDPFTHPIIDPKLLDTAFDRETMIYSIRAAQRFAAAHAFDGYVTGPYADLSTEQAILDYMGQWATTIKHPFCTARVDVREGHGVVDGQLLLKNVRGVRIVDASVWPFIPAGHPQAPIYITAERAADLIKAAW